MQNKKVVIIDNDRNYIAPLANGLKQAGIKVLLCDENRDVLEFVRQAKPDLIISEVHLDSIDSHEFFKRLKSLPEFKYTPFVFMSSQKNVDERIKNIELGVDDFIPKPFHIEETVSRIKNLLYELSAHGGFQTETENGFTGNLAEMNLIDLIQTLELGKKSAVIKLKHQNSVGEVYISEGNVINARLEQFDGEEAILRMFTWTIGYFVVEICDVSQPQKIQKTNKELIDIGLRRLSSWQQMKQGLPPLQAAITTVGKTNSDDLSDDERKLLQMIPEKIHLFSLIEKSPFDDLKALEIIRSLYQKGYIQETEDNYNYYVEEYLNRVRENNRLYQNPTERAAALVTNILKKSPEDRKFPERREGDRRQLIDRRSRGRRQSDQARKNNPVYLSKIELLMIKEALS